MNPAQLLRHFDRISDAPDAIPHLRRFILDLAVRGKLVEQDPNDEPASDLIKGIQEEKARLVKAGKLRDQRPCKSIVESSAQFQIPQTWEWVPATFPAYLISELGKKVQTKDVLETGTYPVVDQGKVFIRGYCNDKTKVIRVESPIILFGDHTRETKLIDFDFVVGADGVKLLHPVCLLADYYYLALTWLPLNSRGYGRHFKLLRAATLPLPPLAEQHRVVVKVDELMALCDRLEAAQAEREQRRDRLVAASLYRLNQLADAEETVTFREHAQFTLSHLQRLTTRPDQVPALRQTILNLAIRGQLVPQDPSDEPASELLERIRAEKSRMEKERTIKREKPAEPVGATIAPFATPKTWKWARLADLTELITKGSSPNWQGIAYVSKDEGILFVTSENVGNYRLLKLGELKYVERRFNEIEPRSVLRYGDILMNLVGASIGRTAIFDLREVANINQAVALIRLIKSVPNLCVEFLLHYLNSPPAIQFMTASQVVTAQPNISLTNAREFPVPVPPLTEQHRIVAKVEELMAMCDQLESQLTTAQTESRRLLESVLHEALAPLAA